MIFPEGEPVSDFGEEELEGFEEDDDEGGIRGIREYLEEVEIEGKLEAMKGDPVARLYYVEFWSKSAGRGRERKYRKRVRLVGWGKKKCIEVNEDGSRGLDRMAEEVLGDTVPAEDCLRVLLERLEIWHKVRRIARGQK